MDSDLDFVYAPVSVGKEKKQVRLKKKRQKKIKRRPSWKSAFPPLEVGIPEYDAKKDKYCVLLKKENQTRKQKKKRPSTSHYGGVNKGDNGLGGNEKGITMQILDDKNKTIELNVLKNVLERERLKELVLALIFQKKEWKRCFMLLRDITKISVSTVESILRWRECIGEPIPFMYNNGNYMISMIDDLSPLDVHTQFGQKLREFLGYKVEEDETSFRFSRNPFLTRNGLGPAGQSPSLISQTLADTIQNGCTVDIAKSLELMHSMGNGEYSTLPSESRILSVQLILLLEESMQSNKKSVKETDKIEQENVEMETKEDNEQTTSNTLKAMENKSGGRKLPPLKNGTFKTESKYAKSKLEKMDQDILLCEKTISTLKEALAFLHDSRAKQINKKKSRKLKLNNDIVTRTICDFDRKIEGVVRDLEYRNMELGQKKLARHRFITKRAKHLDSQIKRQVDEELKSLRGVTIPVPPVKSKPPKTAPSSSSSRVKKRYYIKCVRLTAKDIVKDSISTGIANFMLKKHVTYAEKSENNLIEQEKRIHNLKQAMNDDKTLLLEEDREICKTLASLVVDETLNKLESFHLAGNKEEEEEEEEEEAFHTVDQEQEHESSFHMVDQQKQQEEEEEEEVSFHMVDQQYVVENPSFSVSQFVTSCLDEGITKFTREKLIFEFVSNIIEKAIQI